MFEQQNQFMTPPMVPTQQPGNPTYLFGDVTIIHNQQIDPMSRFNRQVESFNNRMMGLMQYNLEQQTIQLKRAELELKNKALNLQAQQIGLLDNSEDIKPAIEVKQCKLSNALIDSDDEIEDVEYTVNNVENIKVSKSIISAECKDYVKLDNFFTKDYELNDEIKSILMTKGHTGFMGEGGTFPAIIFARHNSNTPISTYWKHVLKTVYNSYKHATISKAGFITNRTPYILFIYDSTCFKADIIFVQPVEENEFLNIDVPKKVEDFSICKEFRNWVEDDNPLILSGRINSVYIFAEPLSVNNIEFPKKSSDRLENISISAIFSDKSYSINIKDLALKYVTLYNH